MWVQPHACSDFQARTRSESAAGFRPPAMYGSPATEYTVDDDAVCSTAVERPKHTPRGANPPAFLWKLSLVSSDSCRGVPLTGCFLNFRTYGTALTMSYTVPSSVHTGSVKGVKLMAQQ